MKTSKLRLRRTGLIAIVVVLLATAALFNKNQIATMVDRGETIEINFPQDYKLRPDVSKVKVGFVPVGRVSGVEQADDGSAIVSVKVGKKALATLGSEPSATVRPTTVLGGSYFVDLKAGGAKGAFRGDRIPVSRTSVPVELDSVAQALQPDALRGLQGSLGHLRGSLDERGRDAVARLLADSPGTLEPGATVLNAARGTRPEQDLVDLVSNFRTTARALSARPGELERIVQNLATTTTTLRSRSGEVGTALHRLPAALDNTRTGLRGLEATLTTLEDVADETRPVATELGRTLHALAPVLERARPAISDLRHVARDARPVLTDLVPTAGSGRQVVDDVRGPVIDRVNGPVLRWLYAPYQGTGMYKQTSSKRPMYEETTFALVNVDRASALMDDNGHAIAFQPGIGTGSVGGLPISLDQFVQLTTLWNYPGVAQASGLPAIGSTVNQLLTTLGGN